MNSWILLKNWRSKLIFQNIHPAINFYPVPFLGLSSKIHIKDISNEVIRKHYLVILVEVSLNMNYTKKACRCGYWWSLLYRILIRYVSLVLIESSILHKKYTHYFCFTCCLSTASWQWIFLSNFPRKNQRFYSFFLNALNTSHKKLFSAKRDFKK